MLHKELESLSSLFEQRLASKMRKKLGILIGEQTEDEDLISKWLRYLETEQLDYTLSFRRLADLATNDDDDGFFKKTVAFQDFCQFWRKRIQNQNLKTRTIKEKMNSVNPVFIPRNHKIEQVIESGLQGDFSPFHEMNSAYDLKCELYESVRQLRQ
jgi:uncharacterized protein YdiU (UPF0061 family)